ncbi:MAG: hypothetical protein ACREQE_00095 [Candidatus Binataceae bacterium]
MAAGIDHADIQDLAEKRFAGELDEDFSSVLERVQMRPRRHGSFWREFPSGGDARSGRLGSAARRLLRQKQRSDDRHVAFDGFRGNLHDEKIERDRRYGTVYTVSEELNAYLVRLEFPRKLPNSSLKRIWQLGDEMPDYEYSLTLERDALSIRGGVRGERYRRLSYISASFPSEFLTRIQFERPVMGFKHRMRDKVLKLVVFKLEDPVSTTGI